MFIYAIKDEMSGYMAPVNFPSDEFTKRAFEAELTNPESMISRFQKDYSIWKIGEFNTETGEFKNDLKLIARGDSYIKEGDNVSKKQISEE